MRIGIRISSEQRTSGATVPVTRSFHNRIQLDLVEHALVDLAVIEPRHLRQFVDCTEWERLRCPAVSFQRRRGARPFKYVTAYTRGQARGECLATDPGESTISERGSIVKFFERVRFRKIIADRSGTPLSRLVHTPSGLASIRRQAASADRHDPRADRLRETVRRLRRSDPCPHSRSFDSGR